ncbi:MAG: ABC transporter permease, partial [bacterium]
MSTTTPKTPQRTFPYTLHIEKRVEDIPRWLPAATSLGSVIIAFIIAGIILKLIGGQPLVVLRFFFNATFGSWPVFSDTLVKATPLIMVGLACTVAFKM